MQIFRFQAGILFKKVDISIDWNSKLIYAYNPKNKKKTFKITCLYIRLIAERLIFVCNFSVVSMASKSSKSLPRSPLLHRPGQLRFGIINRENGKAFFYFPKLDKNSEEKMREVLIYVDEFNPKCFSWLYCRKRSKDDLSSLLSVELTF